jgi:hypothetical protein
VKSRRHGKGVAAMKKKHPIEYEVSSGNVFADLA